jgi:hypothetical protein
MENEIFYVARIEKVQTGGYKDSRLLGCHVAELSEEKYERIKKIILEN